VEELNLNWLWILLYITKAPQGYRSKVWFDNIVVAREYIGPMNTETLWSDTSTIPAGTGGSANLTLAAGMCEAFRNYILVGSLSGTSPGTHLPGGMVTLPINWDKFTGLVILLANSPIFTNFLGTLSETGSGEASLNLPPVPDLVGLTMYYAYGLGLPWDFASNYVSVLIVP
jgi:hypothetical protein